MYEGSGRRGSCQWVVDRSGPDNRNPGIEPLVRKTREDGTKRIGSNKDLSNTNSETQLRIGS